MGEILGEILGEIVGEIFGEIVGEIVGAILDCDELESSDGKGHIQANKVISEPSPPETAAEIRPARERPSTVGAPHDPQLRDVMNGR